MNRYCKIKFKVWFEIKFEYFIVAIAGIEWCTMLIILKVYCILLKFSFNSLPSVVNTVDENGSLSQTSDLVVTVI